MPDNGREVEASLQAFDFEYVEEELTLDDLDEMFDELLRTTGAFSDSFVVISPSTAKRIRRLLVQSEKKRLLHQKRFPRLTKREFERILIK